MLFRSGYSAKERRKPSLNTLLSKLGNDIREILTKTSLALVLVEKTNSTIHKVAGLLQYQVELCNSRKLFHVGNVVDHIRHSLDEVYCCLVERVLSIQDLSVHQPEHQSIVLA